MSRLPLPDELAHSWSGNLVTNATWRDFWLNEGTTVYFEQRIVEEIYGVTRGEASPRNPLTDVSWRGCWTGFRGSG